MQPLFNQFNWPEALYSQMQDITEFMRLFWIFLYKNIDLEYAPLIQMQLNGICKQTIISTESEYSSEKQFLFDPIQIKPRIDENLVILLKEFFDYEKIDGKIEVNSMGDTETVKMKKELVFASNYFVIEFNQLIYAGATQIKFNKFVKYPLILSLAEFSFLKSKYYLTAVIVHSGLAKRAHYFAIIKIKLKWYKF